MDAYFGSSSGGGGDDDAFAGFGAASATAEDVAAGAHNGSQPASPDAGAQHQQQPQATASSSSSSSAFDYFGSSSGTGDGADDPFASFSAPAAGAADGSGAGGALVEESLGTEGSSAAAANYFDSGPGVEIAGAVEDWMNTQPADTHAGQQPQQQHAALPPMPAPMPPPAAASLPSPTHAARSTVPAPGPASLLSPGGPTMLPTPPPQAAGAVSQHSTPSPAPASASSSAQLRSPPPTQHTTMAVAQQSHSPVISPVAPAAVPSAVAQPRAAALAEDANGPSDYFASTDDWLQAPAAPSDAVAPPQQADSSFPPTAASASHGLDDPSATSAPVADYFSSADDWLQPQAPPATAAAQSHFVPQEQQPQQHAGPSDDYFGNSGGGGEDWLQQAAPVPQQQPQPMQHFGSAHGAGAAHAPYGQQFAQSHQAPHPLASHAHPAHALSPPQLQQQHPGAAPAPVAATSLPYGHLPPHLQQPPPQHLADQFNDVDLGATPTKPPRPSYLSHASSTDELADVSLNSSPQAARYGGSSYEDQMPQRGMPQPPSRGEAEQAPSQLYMPRAGGSGPFPPTAAAAPSAVAGHYPPSATTAYGRAAETGAPSFRPMMPAPGSAAAPTSAPAPYFIPGSAGAGPGASPNQQQQQAPVPWQPQSAPMQQQQQQPQQQHPAYSHGQSNGHPSSDQSNSLFASPGSLYSPASGAGPSHPSSMRAWTPPPACPLVCFGFGGKFLSMTPRAAPALFGGAGGAAVASGSLKAGPIVIESLSDLLESQPWVQKLSSFPGPLTVMPNPGAKRKAEEAARHHELESLVQNLAEKAMYARLPVDSPLAALAQPEGQGHGGAPSPLAAEVLSNYRTSKRLLYLFLLELLKASAAGGAGGGEIQRSLNPGSLNTLSKDAAAPARGVEENLVSFLVQLEPSSSASSTFGDVSASAAAGGAGWLDNASSSQHQNISASLVPSPLRSSAVTVADSLELVEERKNQDQVLVRLQDLLLHGQRKEACALAVSARLWSHALLLASFDMATYHSVVGAFATAGFSDGSPLQSLYILFAQQPNLLFRGVAGPDGKGMDGVVVPGPHVPLFSAPNAPPLLRNWKANLAVMLANPTPNDKQVLTTLGDTLWQNYHLPSAAHLCYLLAGHALGPDVLGSTVIHAVPLGRILLLGSDHRKHTRTFVTPAALQRTEIFEYTRTMVATAPSVVAAGATGPGAYGGLAPGFQMFKLLYAYQLAEMGFNTRALAYCEQLDATIAATATKGPGKPGLSYPPTFLLLLDALEVRLREHLGTKSAGPGITKKIASKLFNWIVGDSAAPSGATTTTVPDATVNSAPVSHNLQRSASQSVLRQTAPGPAGPMHGGGGGQLHASASELNLSSHQQPQRHPNGNSYDGSYGGQPAQAQPLQSSASSNSLVAPPPKHTRSSTEPQAGTAASTKKDATASPTPATPEGEDSKKPTGLFGRVLGSMWGAKKKIPKANLKEENSFVFDETLGRWVCKDANGVIQEEEEEKPVAPPSISEEMKAKLAAAAAAPAGSPSMSPGGPLAPMPGPGGAPMPGASAPAMPGMPAPPSSMFASRGGGGAKSRYALSDTSYADSESSASMPMVPTPGLPSMFPSDAAPMPGGGAAGPGPFVPAAGAPGAPAPAFKVFRPAAVAAPMPGVDGGMDPAAQQQQQPQQPYGGGAPNAAPNGQQQSFSGYGGAAPSPQMHTPPLQTQPYGSTPPAGSSSTPPLPARAMAPPSAMAGPAHPPAAQHGAHHFAPGMPPPAAGFNPAMHSGSMMPPPPRAGAPPMFMPPAGAHAPAPAGGRFMPPPQTIPAGPGGGYAAGGAPPMSYPPPAMGHAQAYPPPGAGPAPGFPSHHHQPPPPPAAGYPARPPPAMY